MGENLPKIVTLSGASGAGKTTLTKEILKLRPEMKLIVSLTTRRARESDLPGEYRYEVSPEEFTARKAANEFLWTVDLHGNQYGTLKASVDEALKAKHSFLMLLTPATSEILCKYAPAGSVLPFYILSPNADEIRKRLRGRGEDEATIELRVADCSKWDTDARVSGMPYVFICNNGALEEAVLRVASHLPSCRLWLSLSLIADDELVKIDSETKI